MTVSEILPAERPDNTYWWVKMDANEDWEPAHWFNGAWFMTGSELPWPAPDTLVIGDKIEPPA